MTPTEFRIGLAEMNLTQTAAAPAFGVDVRTVRRWCSEGPSPLAAICLSLYLDSVAPGEPSPRKPATAPIWKEVLSLLQDVPKFVPRLRKVLQRCVALDTERRPINALWAARVLSVADKYEEVPLPSVINIAAATLQQILDAAYDDAEYEKWRSEQEGIIRSVLG